MSRYSFFKRKLAFVSALALSLSLLTGCSQVPDIGPTTVPSDAGTTASDPTVVTEPPATIPADGDPGDITCQGSYTDEDAQAAADDVIAVITVTRTETVEVTAPAETDPPVETTAPAETEAPVETTAPTEPEAPKETEPPEPVYEVITVTEEIPLTNRQLQVFYWLEVAAYAQAGHETVPDFTQSLDTQVCSIDESVGSWQQYFLREALRTWSVARALTLHSQYVPLGLEEAYIPNADKHAEYFVDVPVLSTVYYGNQEYYRPNTLHQAWLDQLPDLLSDLAAANGYADSDALALATAGVSAQDLMDAARLYNLGYMYLTQLSYDIEPTDEEVASYFAEHEAEYAAAGITRDSGKYVSMRHILTLPRNATMDENGTVTASDYDWTQSYWSAQKKLTDIMNTYPRSEGVFATAAANMSLDAGSAKNGGLYENLTPGQLPEELDAWLFDDARKPGDTGLIQSPCGMHMVYFCSSTEIWYATAREDLIASLYRERTEEILAQYPAEVNYSAIRLGRAETPLLTYSDLLYSDIAHERYPESPLYLQQDYPNTRYGAYPIVTHGCGITTMSMLATYMSDTELTPPTLCARYGRYCTEEGSDRTLFVHTPGDMGFYLKQQVFNPSQALQALEEGYIVVCLQHEGLWTSGGHFLLLEKLNENGTIQVRDSNIYNYAKLDGHKIDEFEWKTIPPASVSFWIYHPKHMVHDQCSRCSDAEHAPGALFNTDYLCGRCRTALLRRDAYLNN